MKALLLKQATTLLLGGCGALWAQGGDDCHLATPVTGPGPFPFDTTLATPSTTNPSGISARWFEWTASTSGWVRFSTCESGGAGSFVFLFTDCSNNHEFSAIRNCPVSGAGINRFVQPGDQFLVAISDIVSEEGPGNLRVDPFVPVANDTCGSAQEITGRGPHFFDQTYATDGPIDAACPGVNTEDVWFAWQAPFDGFYQIRAGYEGSNLGPWISVRDGCGALVDECEYKTIRFLASSGSTYWIRLATTAGGGTYTGTNGEFTIELNQAEVRGNGHAYYLNETPMDWTEARSAAEDLLFAGIPGHLATVESFGENNYLASFGGFHWIGFYRNPANPNAPFEWVTGEPVNLTNWLPGRPDSGPLANYTVLVGAGTGQWDDETDEGILLPGYSSLVEWDLNLVGTAFCDPALPNSTEYSTELLGQVSAPGGAGVRLEVRNAPPNQFGYFLVGSAADAVGLMFSQGRFCLGTAQGDRIGRYNIAGTDRDSVGLVDSTGQLRDSANSGPYQTGFEVPATLPLPGNPSIQAGQTWHFQFWHREALGASNFSNGLSIVF